MTRVAVERQEVVNNISLDSVLLRDQPPPVTDEEIGRGLPITPDEAEY